MAPFIINHPSLLHQWIFAREEALKQIREIKSVTKEQLQLFIKCLNQSEINLEDWNTESEYQLQKIAKLKSDIINLKDNYLAKINIEDEFIWNKLYNWVRAT